MEFFNRIVKPLFAGKYDWIEVRRYAEEKKEYLIKYLRSVAGMGADYILVVDINSAPCITNKKQSVMETYKNVDEARIVVIIQEIESWYLAGLDDINANNLGLSSFNNTDNLTKEDFNRLRPQKFKSRVDFMQEILNRFSGENARQKNTSFDYFLKKHIL